VPIENGQLDRDALTSRIDAALSVPVEQEQRAAISANIERQLNLTEDELSASFFNQRDLGEPGLSDNLARMALADADTAGEKLAAFKKHYPDGDLRVAPVTGELLFRENISSSFKKVDAGIMQKFEPVGDLIDFLGSDAGAIIGEIALSKGASSFLGVITRMYLGGFFGESAQQGVQELRGVQQQNLGEVFGQAQTQGGVSAVGGALGLGLGKVVDTVRGGPAVTLAPGAEDALRAGERLGLERNLTVGESLDNPIVKKIEGQSGATLPTIQRYMTARAEELRNIVQKMGDPESAKRLLATDELARANRAERASILQMMKGTQPKTKLSEGGSALNKGLDQYHKRSGQRVTAAYVRARQIQEPAYQISELQQLAREVQEGVPFEKADGSIGRAGESLQGSINDISTQIRQANPDLPAITTEAGDVIPSTEQLRAWRTALWDAKTPAVGEAANNQHRQAGRLYGKITEILKNPKGGSPEFTKAWKQANDMAAERFKTLDQIVLMKVAKDETPAQLAKRLGTANQVDNLKVLRETIPSEKFAKFQDSVKFDMLENADGLTKRLESFDKETLDMLIAPGEQRILKAMGAKIDELNTLNIKDVLARQTKVGAAVRDMFTRNETASISLLGDIVEKNGGLKGDLGQQLRAALIEDFKERVIIREGGTSKVSATAIEGAIKEFRDKGITQFLTSQDMRILANLDEFLPFIRSTTDSGTSLQAASAAAGARGTVTGLLTGQSLGTAALQTVAEHAGVGWLFTKGAPAIRGAGKRKLRRSIKGPLSKTVALLSLASTDKGAYDPTILTQLEMATEQ